MGNAAILYENLADSGTVSASSWIASAPPSMMQDAHVSRRWKGRNADTEYILLDMGSAQSIDTVALFGVQGIFGDDQRNLSEAAVTRVRVSSVDPTGMAGDLHDTGSLSGEIDLAYGSLIELLPSPVSARYVRIDFSEITALALLAGRLVVGLRNPFSINFEYGWGFGYADLSRRKKSAGGQTFVERDDRYRVLSLTFGSLLEVDRYGFVHEADRLNGASQDVLFVLDTESQAPDRDSIWGLVNDLSPPTQPNIAYFAKSYSIEERR